MLITKKPESPVAAADNSSPRISTAPLAEVIISPTAQKITDVLLHKRICHVLNDASFEKSFRSHIAIYYDHKTTFRLEPGESVDPFLLDCSMTITNMSVFLRMLPAKAEHEAEPAAPKAASLAKDLILIESPVLLEPDAFDTLKAGLAVFRSAHPYAAIVSGTPLTEAAALQMGVLRDAGLVDEVGTDDTETSPQLVFRGAVILEQKLTAAIKAGDAVMHVDPADVHEEVLIEPKQ
jgi:hypothetical protein